MGRHCLGLVDFIIEVVNSIARMLNSLHGQFACVLNGVCAEQTAETCLLSQRSMQADSNLLYIT